MFNNNHFKPKDSCCSNASNAEFLLNGSKQEIRQDLTASQPQVTTIWGYVRNCSGAPLGGVLVNLFGYNCHDKNNLEKITHTHTDCNGLYQFNIPVKHQGYYHLAIDEDDYILPQGLQANGCAHKPQQTNYGFKAPSNQQCSEYSSPLNHLNPCDFSLKQSSKQAATNLFKPKLNSIRYY